MEIFNRNIFLDKAKYKNKNLSLKDYYIFLYYIHIFNQCNHFKTFMRGTSIINYFTKNI